MVNDHPPDFSNGPASRPLTRGPHLVAVLLGPARLQKKDGQCVAVLAHVAADLALGEAWLVDPVLGAAQHLVLEQVGAIFDRVVPSLSGVRVVRFAISWVSGAFLGVSVVSVAARSRD
jgi:hypothetical protein